VYRPEFQYSLYDLSIDKINRYEKDATDGEDILKATQPIITSSDDLIEILYNLDISKYTPVDYFNTGEEKELIFAIGEQELRAKINENDKLEFTNLEHLASLDAEDFLTIRLYTNNDAGNILWEYAFGVGPQGAPNTALVSADSPHQDIVVYIPTDLDSVTPKNVKLKWTVTGGGSIAESVTTSSIGIFPNTITTPVMAGTKLNVSVKVIASDDSTIQVGMENTYGPYEVIPGVPHHINLTATSATLLTTGVDTSEISAKVFDQHNNAVADGTPISWRVEGSGDLLSPETLVTAGSAKTTYQVGKEHTPTLVTAQAGKAVKLQTFNKLPLTVNLTTNRDFLAAGSLDTASLSVTLNQAPAKPLPIYWSTSRGELIASSTMTGTTATATLKADAVPGDGFVRVNVGGVKTGVAIEHRATDIGSIQFDHAALVAAAEGSISQVETLSNGTVSHTNITSTETTVIGTPGTTFKLRAGGAFTPNSLPSLYLSMNEIQSDEGDTQLYTYDMSNGLKAQVKNDVVVSRDESYTQPGSSLEFNDGTLELAGSAELNIDDNLYVNVRVRPKKAAEIVIGDPSDPTDPPEPPPQSLIKKGTTAGNAFQILLVKEGGAFRVKADVSTDTGQYELLSDSLIQPDQWSIVGLRFTGGKLELAVNYSRQSLPAPGTLLYQTFASHTVIGEQYKGFMDELRMGEESTARALIVMGNGEAEETVTIGADGKATMTVKSTGNEVKANQRIGFTATYVNSLGQLETREIKIASRVTRRLFSFLETEKSWADAVSTEKVTEHEDGLAMVTGDSFAQAVEMMKSSGAAVYGFVKDALEFLYEMSGFSDLYTIGESIYLWLDGRFDEVDKFDLVFAGIGLTLSIVAIVTSPTGAGTGAALSLKGALKGLKATLKELITDPATLVKAGGVVVGWTVKLLKDFLTGNRALAVKQLKDLGDLFVHMLSSGGAATLELFSKVVRSAKSFGNLITIFRNSRRMNCGIVSVNDNNTPGTLLAKSSGLLLLLQADDAYANGGFCSLDAVNAIRDRVLNNSKFGGAATAAKVAEEVSDIIAMLGKYDIPLKPLSIERLADIVHAGHGADFGALVKNADNKLLHTLDLSKNGFGRILDTGETVMDRFLEGLSKLPNDAPGYSKFMERLKDGNPRWIRGMFSEAESFSSVKTLFDIEPGTLKLDDKVTWNGRENQFGIDLQLKLKSGQDLFVESKHLGKNSADYAKLTDQFDKHLHTKIERLLTEDRPPKFLNGKIPLLHYEFRGGFDNIIEVRKRFVALCNKEFRKIKRAGFSCEDNITFAYYGDQIDHY
jgi:hypothetical protein